MPGAGNLPGWTPGAWIAAAIVGAVLALSPGPAEAGRLVAFAADYPPGSILISQSARKLYLILDGRTAVAYPVAVATQRDGMERDRRASPPNMSSPRGRRPNSVRRDHPDLPDVIPGGSPINPMGARALELDRSEIAIHGTTRSMRASIGTAASYGCIRMLNEDVIDLYDRVPVGAPVFMTP